MKTRTALVRKANGDLKVMRYDDYESNAEFAEELNRNGYKVLNVWARDVSDREADEWEWLNRKQ